MVTIDLVYGRCGRQLPYLLVAIKKAQLDTRESLVIVPEQYTLQVERDIISGLQVNGLIDVTVLSPTRLSGYIAQRAGRSERTVLTTQGTHIAMSLALTKMAKKLEYYRSVCDKAGFVDQMITLIRGLKNGGMTFEKYIAYLDTEMKESVRMKHQDILCIWQAYEEILEGRFVDTEDAQDEMLQRLAQNELLKDMTVLLYGFDMLSEKVMMLSLYAAKCAAHVAVVMMMDNQSAPDGDIYQPMRSSLARLSHMAEDSGLKVRWLPLEKTELKAAPAIRHIEENLFAFKPNVFKGDASAVQVHCYLTPYQETMRVAVEIRRLHEMGIPYGEIAVLLLNEERYQSFLPAVFESYGITHYMARKAPASSHGLVRFLMSALQMMASGYERHLMMTHLKSGFTLLEKDECNKLENYVIEQGISRRKWEKPFTRGENCEEMESLRIKVITPLEKLSQAMTEAKSAQSTMIAVFELMSDVAAYSRLLADEERLLANGMQSQAAQDRQVWQKVLLLLEQMVELLGDKRVPKVRAATWLEAGLSQAELSALPPTADEVVVGEAGHIMAGKTQAVFVLGLQDDALMRSSGALLSDDEMLEMRKHTQVSLIPVSEDMSCLAKCDMIKAVSMPSHRLYISYAESTSEGAPLRPNALVAWLTSRVFHDLKIQGSVLDKPYDISPIAPMPALETLVQRKRLNDMDDDWQEAYRWLSGNDKYREMLINTLEAMEGKPLGRPEETLTREVARPLFVSEKTSISRLEAFAACPYKHFISYGLKPECIEEYAFTSLDKGNFYHNALKTYLDLALKEEDWLEFDRAQSDALLDKAIQQELLRWEEGPLYETKRNMAQVKTAINVAKRAAWLVLKHAQNGQFRTIATELKFGGDEGGLPPLVLTLPDGSNVALQGTIDRVDALNDGDKTYLRIVDYKSSPHDLEPSEVAGGLQLQLLLYFDAILSASKGKLPGGAFYFHVHDKLLASDVTDEKKIEQMQAKQYHLKGYALSQANVVNAMSSESEGYSSVGRMLKKEGEFLGSAAVLSMEQWEKLLRYVRKKAVEMAHQINQGVIRAHPFCTRTETGCTYCEYSTICLKDASQADACLRIIPEMKKTAFATWIDEIEI